MALKLAVLPRAYQDLHWFRIYYKDHFPEGMAKANARFEKATTLLCEYPQMGSPAGKPSRRRFSVPYTPYTIRYRQRGDFLEIVRVLDQRRESYLKDLFDP